MCKQIKIKNRSRLYVIFNTLAKNANKPFKNFKYYIINIIFSND